MMKVRHLQFYMLTISCKTVELRNEVLAHKIKNLHYVNKIKSCKM